MSNSGKSGQWYGLHLPVFLIGMLSIGLFLWVELVSERLHTNEDIVDVVRKVQILAATYNLRLEEALTGIDSEDVKEGLTDLDQAITEIDNSFAGEESSNHQIAVPLLSHGLYSRAVAIKSLLVKLKELGLERQERGDKAGSNSALEHDFHALFKKSLNDLSELEDIIQEDVAANQKKRWHLFISIMVSWLFIVVAATVGIWSLERGRKRAEEAFRKSNRQLLSQAEELTEHREHLAELVEIRTAELTAANKMLRIEIAERLKAEQTLKDTEQQNRQLSSRLLTAQEIERKRISMELHDELGQALNVTKLRIRVIEKGLGEDQHSIRENCEELQEYMNHVIENVRRLSLDLSPTILEDLGLTSALNWLVNNLTRSPNTIVSSDIGDIDHLVPAVHWITVYRVIQEALTNIGKHAQAENASVLIRHHDDKLIFSVVDNGNGFELNKEPLKYAPEKGLGLSTIAERVRMMDGDLDLWSQPGIGTSINFSIPVREGVL